MFLKDYFSVLFRIIKGYFFYFAGFLCGFFIGFGVGCLFFFIVVEVVDLDFKVFLVIWERKNVIRKRNL